MWVTYSRSWLCLKKIVSSDCCWCVAMC